MIKQRTKISIFALFFLIFNISYNSVTSLAEWISIPWSLTIPVTVTAVNGSWWTASWQNLSTLLLTDEPALCSAWTSSWFTLSWNTWSWTCDWTNWWSSVSISAYKIINWACWTARWTTVTETPATSELCLKGTGTLPIISGSTYTWTCNWVNTWANVNCSALKKIDWLCWDSDRKSLDSKPSTSLCSAWEATEVLWSGPWTWTCNWVNDWITNNCRALKTLEKINWSCWTASWVNFYTTPTTNLCSTWTSTWETLSGSTYSWTCNWVNDWTSINCSAIQKFDWICWTASWATLTSAPTNGAELCSVWTSTWANLSGSTYSWTCIWVNSWITNNCTASKKTTSWWGWWWTSYITCTDSKLECVNNIYTLKSWNYCIWWNLWKTCVSQTTNSWTTNTGTTTDTTETKIVKTDDWSIVIKTTEDIPTPIKTTANDLTIIQIWDKNDKTKYEKPIEVQVKVEDEWYYKISKLDGSIIEEIKKDKPINYIITFLADSSWYYIVKPISLEEWENTDTWSIKIDLSKFKPCKMTSIVDFTDIDETFAKDYIVYLNKMWVVTWYSDSTFKPEANATRSEYLKMALCTFWYWYEWADTANINYWDIDKSNWQAEVVATATLLWVIDLRNANFRPNDSISRAEALRILTWVAWIAHIKELANLAPSKLDITKTTWENTPTTIFNDINMPWMNPYIKICYDLWIISWQEVNWNLIFRPNMPITRAEVSKIVMKALKLK